MPWIEPSTTVLSPYMKFGCLSARTMYWQLVSVCQVKKNEQLAMKSALEKTVLWIRNYLFRIQQDKLNFFF